MQHMTMQPQLYWVQMSFLPNLSVLLTCSAQVYWASGATSAQPLPGESPPTGGDATAVGLGPPGVVDGAGAAATVATGVGVAAGGTPYGNETGELRPPGAKRVALVGLGVVTAVVALGLMVPTVGLGVAVAVGVTAGEGDLEPFAPALRRPVANVLVGVAAGVTPVVAAGVTPAVAAGVAVAVTAGVAAAVTAGVVIGAAVINGPASGGTGVTWQRPQVMAQYPPYAGVPAQAVQLPIAFYRKTHSFTDRHSFMQDTDRLQILYLQQMRSRCMLSYWSFQRAMLAASM